jgi:molybdopterin molybdotransferase
LVGVAVAGQRYRGPLGRREAVRIFTGAPLPDGADAVLPQEDATVDGSELLLDQGVEALRHVRLAGGDFNIGDTLLPSGRRLGPRELAIAAAANLDRVTVHRKPRVVALSIGDELQPPGTDLGPDQIVATNALAIVELARNIGADAIDLGIVPDSIELVTKSAKREAETSDVLVTIGGASVGDHDVARPALAAAGMDLEFWRIAMRPGKPLVFGRLGGMAVLGLPGNPVSSFVCGLVFLRPLIAALLGLPHDDQLEPAILGSDVAANGPRTTYLRATMEGSNGLPIVLPLQDQDSAHLSVLVRADCLLVRPSETGRSAAGSICSIIRL